MAVQTASTAQIAKFVEQGQADTGFIPLLVESLQQANQIAQAQLDPGLYKALAWPTDFNAYIDYLKAFAHLIPHQSLTQAPDIVNWLIR